MARLSVQSDSDPELRIEQLKPGSTAPREYSVVNAASTSDEASQFEVCWKVAPGTGWIWSAADCKSCRSTATSSKTTAWATWRKQRIGETR